MSPRLVAGCMTGTSIDSLDAALVEVTGHGLEIRARLVRALTRPLAGLADGLRRLAEQEPMTAGEIARLSRDLGLLHLAALKELAGGDLLDLAVVHGQTVFHAPPLSWQVVTATPIARGLGAPIVFDLRAADLAAGGQGAPITPLADWLLLRNDAESRAVVNLGGFCNVTLLPGGGGPEGVRGKDVCACNHLLDGIARKLLGRAFDEDGAAASAGTVHDEALEDLGGVLAAQAGGRRSLGTGDETGEWISRWRAHVAPGDLAATACEAIGEAVARAVMGSGRILLAGGGARNRALVRAVESCCSAAVEATDAHGVPGGYREAMGMAVLGALCQDRVAITLPAVTGVREAAPVAGVWVYP